MDACMHMVPHRTADRPERLLHACVVVLVRPRYRAIVRSSIGNARMRRRRRRH